MNCVICGSNDWTNVDEYRFKPSGMSICNTCSFVSYPVKWKTEEEIKEHYRTDYRNPPTSGNLYSGQRKLHFHNVFLKPLFDEWKKEGRIEPEVGEIGAAYGMVLAWVRDMYPGAKVSGTELTTSYRKNAFHEFGIELTEDFDYSKKYDLIITYKVAEHQLDIDKMLLKYKECLKPNGVMYISVPCWFNQIYNFGMGGFDLEYYYSTDHINVWTRKLFESLLKKVGLEIIKEDHVIYDSTYLVKSCDPKELTKDDFENVDDIKDKMKRIKEAFMACYEHRYDDAIKIYPNYPQAHIARVEYIRKQAFGEGWDWIKENIINKMFRECSESAELYVSATDLAMRAKQFEDAIKYAEMGLKARPNNPVSLGQLINIMREIALRSETKEKKAHYFGQARQISRHLKEVSLQNARESVDFIYLFNSHLPIPEEKKHN